MPIERKVDNFRHLSRLGKPLQAKKFDQLRNLRPRISYQRRIVDFDKVRVRRVLKPLQYFVAMGGKAALELVHFELGAFGGQTIDHFPLRIDHFFDGPGHENDFVIVVQRQT